MQTSVFRAHPVTVFFSLTKYFWILTVPIIRTVLALGFDVQNAFAGSEADITVISLLFIRAVIKQRCSSLCFPGGDILLFKSGLILKKELSASKERISCVTVSENPITKLFKCRKITLYLKNADRPLAEIYCKPQAEEEIKRLFGCGNIADRRKNSFISSLLCAVFHLGSKSGLTTAASLISLLGIITGKTLSALAEENLATAARLIRSLPAALFAVGLILLFIKILSVCSDTFSLVGKVSGRVYAKRGVLFKKSLYFGENESGEIFIKSLFLPHRQSVCKVTSGFYQNGGVMLCSTKGEHEPCSDKAVFPSPKSRLSFVLFPCALFCMGCFVSGFCFSAGLFYNAEALVFFIPLLLLQRIVYSIKNCFYTSLGVCGEKLVLRHANGSRLFCTELYTDKAGKIRLRSTPFQKRRNACNISVYAVGLKRRVRVKNIPCEVQGNSRIFGLFGGC